MTDRQAKTKWMTSLMWGMETAVYPHPVENCPCEQCRSAMRNLELLADEHKVHGIRELADHVSWCFHVAMLGSFLSMLMLDSKPLFYVTVGLGIAYAFIRTALFWMLMKETR